MTTLVRLLGVSILAIGLSARAVPPTSIPTLKIGDRAPVLESISWLQGNPVTKYAPRRVYVVEFWATWCPPCVKAIPHLSAIQKKYANSLTVIGVNADGILGGKADVEAVHDFMKKHGKEMEYTVAMDDPVKKTMSETWVTASGSSGAPTAAIVDRRGKLVWIGYPNVPKGYTFDQALADTLNGKIDLERSRALQAETIKETAKYWATKSQESPWPPGKP
jgi:thiol-disulfide isomerase/thioredoxin